MVCLWWYISGVYGGALFSVYSDGAYNRGVGRFFQKLCLKVLDKLFLMVYYKGMQAKASTKIKSTIEKAQAI